MRRVFWHIVDFERRVNILRSDNFPPDQIEPILGELFSIRYNPGVDVWRWNYEYVRRRDARELC